MRPTVNPGAAPEANRPLCPCPTRPARRSTTRVDGMADATRMEMGRRGNLVIHVLLIRIITHHATLVCRYTNGNGMHNGDNGQGYGYSSSRPSYADRTYSLPRTVLQHQQQQQQLHKQNPYTTQGAPGGYYTTDRRSRSHQQAPPSGGVDTPDFYFMPSQRKYSGEVVRVYVDYNKEPKD